MKQTLKLQIDHCPSGAAIPARFAFGKPGADGPFAASDNISPRLTWSEAPAGTKSFALICHDPDVPSSGEDVNQADRLVPASLPRVDFFHWVLVDIPGGMHELPEGAGSTALVARGKPTGPTGAPANALAGQNSYTGWFAGDPDMEGVYGNYDGPCPPWNDSIVHHYHFTLFALDIPTLGLSGNFTGDDARAAMAGHVLAEALHLGTYSMNPAVKA